MGGFNYGGRGDGTSWSSERGDGPSPGGGSKGNSGNRDNSTTSGGSKNNSQAPTPSFMAPISVKVGEEAAKRSGLKPGLYVGYIVDDYGNVVGIMSSGEDDAIGQDLGPYSSLKNKGGIVKEAPLQGPGPGYTGDRSPAHIAKQKKIIRDNARYVNSGQSGNRIRKAKQATFDAQRELASIKYSDEQKKKEAAELQAGIRLVADFHKELTNKYSKRASELAQELANKAKGKRIRNVEQAVKAYDKYRSSLNTKFSAKDRKAIATALRSLDQKKMASQLSKISKALGYYGTINDYLGVINELIKSFETDNWRPALVKIESIAAGRVASALTAFAFSVILGIPLGIFGLAMIMALVSAFINEPLMESINRKLGI